jgi:transposase
MDIPTPYITAFTEVVMGGKKYTIEFKVEAAKQVLDHGRPVSEVAARLGVSIDSLYAWVREQRKATAVRQADSALAVENRCLQAELNRLTEEPDTLKKAAAYFAKD